MKGTLSELGLPGPTPGASPGVMTTGECQLIGPSSKLCQAQPEMAT